MNEELEKEADEYAKKDCPDNFLCTRDIAKRGYLAGAEPREKRIAELEQENKTLRTDCSDYLQTIKTLSRKLKQNVDLASKAVDIVEEWKKKTEELEAYTEKMKWYFVKDKLPPKSEEYKICSEDLLFVTKNGKRYFGYFNSRNEFEAHNQPYGRFRVEEVYAWKEIVFPELKEIE